MRAPRRRTLRRGGRRAEAPFQGASAARSMATLAGAACVGRHELPCRHTAREFFGRVHELELGLRETVTRRLGGRVY